MEAQRQSGIIGVLQPEHREQPLENQRSNAIVTVRSASEMQLDRSLETAAPVISFTILEMTK